PPATAGSGYSVSLAANGGQTPYTWSFGQSSLPQGFSIDSSGNVTGTPSKAGRYVFNVVVSDKLKNNVTGQLTLLVTGNSGSTTLTATPPPTPPPPTAPPPPTPPKSPVLPVTVLPVTVPPVTTPPVTTPPPTTPPPTTPPPATPPPTTPPPTTPPPTTPPPTTPPPTTPPTTPIDPPTTPTGPATGTALIACQDLTSSGTYYLANDVSSAGSCFGIDANNITLNLNAHTITYGTGGGSTPTPAIEAHDSWWTGTPNYTGNTYASSRSHSGLEIYGGNIVQSPNSATFSAVFAFGQGTFTSAPYIHNITATFQNTGAQFYYSAFMPAGARIEKNTIYDNVTNIQQPGQGYLSARAQFQGQSIFISGQENNLVASGDLISGNKIVGGPQGGIRTVDQYSTITSNDIAQNANYSNDWCVEISADHSTATGNNCHPKSGRGINIDASYVTVQNNTINVTELPQNMEYGTNGQPGCEGGGSYGIRVETMPLPNQPGTLTNDTVSGNTITVSANACNAMGFDLIYLPATASGINITGNTITTTNANQSGVQDSGFQFDDSFGNGVSITGNTVTSVDEWMYGAWDGYSGITVGHNTWNGSSQLTFLAGDGGCDPTQTDSAASCPVSINITDNLPNKVTCGAFSVATVTVNGQVTVCKPTE
ncbi:MAG: Ig domain-containing protein, partial [Acidobacteriaceae bacterium]